MNVVLIKSRIDHLQEKDEEKLLKQQFYFILDYRSFLLNTEGDWTPVTALQIIPLNHFSAFINVP